MLYCNHRLVQLHGFCDSSANAYSAGVYIRNFCSHGVQVRLLTSKNHLVPSKSLSIPRLELLSCVLLAKLVSSVQSALVSEVTVANLWLWSDSKVAPSWIKQVDKKWKA